MFASIVSIHLVVSSVQPVPLSGMLRGLDDPSITITDLTAASNVYICLYNAMSVRVSRGA